MSKYRQIAVRLLDLHSSDREWVLDQLPTDDREQVVAALADVAMDASERDDLSQPRRSTATESRIVDAQSALDRVRGWDASTLSRLLADEPAWVTTLALSALDRSVAQAVLEQMESTKGDVVRHALSEREQPTKAHPAELVAQCLIDKAARGNMAPIAATNFEAVLQRVSETPSRFGTTR